MSKKPVPHLHNDIPALQRATAAIELVSEIMRDAKVTAQCQFFAEGYNVEAKHRQLRLAWTLETRPEDLGVLVALTSTVASGVIVAALYVRYNAKKNVWEFNTEFSKTEALASRATVAFRKLAERPPFRGGRPVLLTEQAADGAIVALATAYRELTGR